MLNKKRFLLDLFFRDSERGSGIFQKCGKEQL
jgi:hypothetical protein